MGGVAKMPGDAEGHDAEAEKEDGNEGGRDQEARAGMAVLSLAGLLESFSAGSKESAGLNLATNGDGNQPESKSFREQRDEESRDLDSEDPAGAERPCDGDEAEGGPGEEEWKDD